MVFVPVPTALRRSGLAAACGALLALGPITAVAAPTAPADGGELRAPVHAPTSPTGRWFVSLDDGSPVGTGAAAPADSAAAAAAVDGFVEQVADLPDEVARTARIVDTHEDLWTGAVVEAPDSAIDAVAALPGVTAVHPVLTTAVPTEVTATSPASVPGGDAAGTGPAGTEPAGTEPAARTGRGVRVAVIDTGVDLDHPAFGGTGVNGTTPFPNDVVVGGWDFVGDAYNENPVLGSEYDASARPDARPDDCNGHGTHVAGLLAGRDGDPRFTGGPGVAAEAQLLAYRVFGCSGFTSADIVVSAFEAALADGADVVNFSAAFVGMPWPDYPTAVAAQRLVGSGVVVVAAQGNDPSRSPGLFSSGAPGVAPDVISVGAGTRNSVDDYSISGPSATLGVKPDVITEGRSLYSAYPVEKGWGGTATGTSGAAPRVAGLAARLVEEFPSASVAEIGARIVGTAVPVGSPGGYAPVPRQGGGHVDVTSRRAAETTVTVSPARLSFGESSGGPRDIALTVTNHSGAPVHLTLDHETAMAATGDPDAPSTTVAAATVTGDRAVTVPARGTATLRASVVAPGGDAGTLYGGYLVLTGGAHPVRVPYVGMVGDFADLPLFSRDVGTQPTLARVTSCESAVGPDCVDPAAVRTYVTTDGHVFGLQGTDVPNVVLSFAYPAATLRIEALRVARDGSLTPVAPGAAPHVDALGQGRTADGGIVPWTWDGTYRTAVTEPYPRRDGTTRSDLSEALQVPAGTYRLRVTATRALATEGDPREVETWTSPAFVIRPAVTPAHQWMLGTRLGGQADLSFRFGGSTDTDVYVGNWDGKGGDGLAYRRGNTFYLRNELSTGTSERAVAYGRPGDTVYVGDWDGDGVDTFAVRRGNTFYLSNDFRGGEASIVTAYGRPDDEVVVGDWDGDGVDTPAVRRGNVFYLKNSFAGGEADIVLGYGRATDAVYAGDWDGDGLDTLVVRRGNTYYFSDTFEGGIASRERTFGRADDATVVGDWTGSGSDSIGVARTS